MPNILNAWPTDANGNPYVSPLPGSTVRTNAGSVAPGQTAMSVTSQNGVSLSAATTIPLFTVPSNRNLYITDMQVDVDTATNSAKPVLAQLAFNTTPTTTPTWTVFWEGVVSATASVSLAGLETQEVAPAGSQVALIVGAPTAAVVVSYDFAGVLQ